MKITRSELKKLVQETINQDKSILLEGPDYPVVGQEQNGDYDKDPDGYEGELAKRSLFHMSQQSQQLHDMLMGDENLEPWVQDKITKAADYLEKAFKAILYDKQNPGGQ